MDRTFCGEVILCRNALPGRLFHIGFLLVTIGGLTGIALAKIRGCSLFVLCGCTFLERSQHGSSFYNAAFYFGIDKMTGLTYPEISSQIPGRFSADISWC